MTPGLRIGPLLPLAETALWTTAGEQAHAAAFRNERRRSEYLTWRTMLRRELGRDLRIGYDEVGAPVLPDGEGFISVSHGAGRVAVCLSPRRCAVDIESAGRDFLRVADRFMTPSERLLSDDPLWPGFVWCAKETLYKYAGRRSLDLREDLRILSSDLAAERIVGRIGDEPPLELTARLTDGCLLVFYC